MRAPGGERRRAFGPSAPKQLALGLALGVVSVGLLCAARPAAWALAGAPAIAATAAASALPDAAAAASGLPEVKSLRPGAPPREVGPRFDHDAAMASHADDIASYTIHVHLDATAHILTAKGTIRWKNASSEPAHELWLHLYLNAFKNDRTLFLRSPFGAGRSGEKAREWGYIDVHKLVARELGNVDLWKHADKHSPHDPDDQTDIRVPLPEAVEPGQTLTLDTAWTAQLPEIVERTGYMGSFHFVGQWFPKIARRDPDGAWVHFEFNPLSEFYSDYGRYDVTIDVPESMRVGATGPRVSAHVSGGRRIVRHVIDNVHDFAWSAWDRFREQHRNVDGVDVRVLYPPGQDDNARRELDAVRFTLPFYGRLYGRYPYPVLTLVHPPEFARNAGGMEYPTLITTGGPWYAAKLGVRSVEQVTIHELGHQWFYGLIATDEHAWPFLDEGLNTFAEDTAMHAHYGRGSLVHAFGLEVDDRSFLRAASSVYGHDQVVALSAARFADFREMGAIVYARTGAIMDTLANVYGEARVQRALGRYARRYRFAHPGPRNFLGVMREVLGEDAADNLEDALFHRGWVDYLVRDLQSTRVRAPGGVFDRASGRETVQRDRSGNDHQWVGRVLVFRHGTLHFPVDIELIARDGTRSRRHWDGHGNWTSVEYRGPSPLVSAVVDPDARIALDDNLLDNAVSSKPGGAPRSLERGVYAAELLLGTLGP